MLGCVRWARAIAGHSASTRTHPWSGAPQNTIITTLAALDPMGELPYAPSLMVLKCIHVASQLVSNLGSTMYVNKQSAGHP